VGTPFNIRRNRLQPIFGDVRIPADVPAGVYQGTLRVMANFITVAQIPVYLTVWNFNMPAERRVSTTFHLYRHKIAQYWGGPGPVQDEDQIRRVAKNFENLLHEFMIDLTNPWKDPNPLDDPPLLPEPFFQFNGDTLLPPDYTNFDAVVGPRLDGSYYSNGVPAVAFNSTLFGPGNDGGVQDLPEEIYILAARDFARHLKEKGWWERIFIYASDEPYLDPGKVEAIAYDATLMRLGDPDWRERIMVTNHWMPELNDSVGIWNPQFHMYDNWSETLPQYGREDYQRLLKEGDKLWFYFTNGGTPPYTTYDIDTIHGHEPLVMNWGCWYEGATGLLHWSSNAWRDEPWVDFNMQENWWWARNGDGFLTWPGDYNGTRGITPGTPLEVRMEGPIISHRLLMIREGLEDWEIFMMAEDMGGGAFARKVVEELVYRQFGVSDEDFDPDDPPWTLDENDVYTARALIAAWIEGRFSPGTGTASIGPGSGDNDVGCSLNTNASGRGAFSFALIGLIVSAVWLGWRRFTFSDSREG